MMKKHNRMNLKFDLGERNSFCLFATKHQILLKFFLYNYFRTIGKVSSFLSFRE